MGNGMQNVQLKRDFIEEETSMTSDTLTPEAFELLIRMLTHDLEKLVVITSRVLQRLLDGSLTLDNERHRSLVASSSYAMTRSRRMITDLNQAMDTRQLAVSIQTCHLKGILAEVAAHFSPMAKNEGIHFNFECCGSGMGNTDPELLTRIVENYLYNAISHTDSGGWIQMKLETGKSGAFAVSVANAGPSIPEADLERIFSVGVQLDLKQKKYWRGSGLGLSFCKMAAEAMGVQVGAENLEGNQGIVFYCRN